MENSNWDRMLVSANTEKRLRGTHRVWTRMMDGSRIYKVVPVDDTPGAGDGGYFSVFTALSVKGMSTAPPSE